MHLLRRSLPWLLAALGIVVLLAASLFTSPVQTILAQAYLSNLPDLDYSLESLTAGSGHLDASNLHLRRGRVVLDVPAATAQLPVYAAWRRSNFRCRSLVAKGWTLNLANCPMPALTQRLAAGPDRPALPEGRIARELTATVAALLSSHTLPCELTCDTLELEGNVLLPPIGEMEPLRLHLKIEGRDLAEGRAGRLEFTASATIDEARFPIAATTIHGEIQLGRESPRDFRVDRVVVHTDVTCRNLGSDRVVAAALTAERTATGTTIALQLERGARQLAELQLLPSATAAAVATGTWQLDLSRDDLQPLWPRQSLPPFAGRGKGTYALDAAGGQLQVTGTLQAGSSAPLPWLSHRSPVTWHATTAFKLLRSPQAVRIEQCEATLADEALALAARTQQPFTCDWQDNGPTLAVDDNHSDWLAISVRRFPLERLPALPAEFSFAAGTATSEFTLRRTATGFAVQSCGPVTASGATLLHSGTALLRDVDLSCPLTAEITPTSWNLQLAPVELARARQPFATLSLNARSSAPKQPWTLDGVWTLNLAPTAPQAWQSATGEFAASFGAVPTLGVKATFRGDAPGTSLAAELHLEAIAPGAVNFRGPLRIDGSGTSTSLTLTGSTRARPGGATMHYADVSGDKVRQEHLALLAGALPVLLPGAQPADRQPATRPLWADCLGQVRLSFAQLIRPNQTLGDASATLLLEPERIRLEGGQARLASGQPAKLEGTLTFKPGDPAPYQLAANLTVAVVDAAGYFPPPEKGGDPLLAGRFDFSDTLAGSAPSLEELPAHINGRFQLTNTAGIIRLLKVRMGDAYTEKAKPVSDALATTGGAFVSILGAKSGSVGSGQKKADPNAAAVADFNYELAELGFQHATIAGTHAPDGTIRLDEIALAGRDFQLHGSGRIEAGDALPLEQRPLQIAMRLSARGRLAGLMATAGLAETGTAGTDGFRPLAPSIEFGGTIAQLDTRRWHDVLVAAAYRRAK